MSLPVLLALALARPVDVSEEWAIVSRAPLLEALTVRARYHRDAGPQALLPAALQGGSLPQVSAVESRGDLAVRVGPHGYEVDLPPGAHEPVRLLIRVVRPVRDARLFQLSWPASPASEVPVRRMVAVPRAWVPDVPVGWTCPDEAKDDVTCVSTERVALPLVTRIPAAPSSPVARVGALVAVLLALAAAFVAGPRARRRERLAGAVGGIAVGAAVALGLAGAYVMTWAPALAVGCGLFALVGATAERNPRASAVGAATLLIVPLVAALDGRLRDVGAVSVVGALAIVGTAFLGGRTAHGDAAA